MTLSSKCFVSQSDTICVDPMLLFSKAGYYSRKHFGELDTVLKQELCSYPPTLFQNNDTLLLGNYTIPYDTLVVLDGTLLLSQSVKLMMNFVEDMSNM